MRTSVKQFIKKLNIPTQAKGKIRTSIDPSTLEPIGTVALNTEDLRTQINKMNVVKDDWASKPAPARGDVVREIGNLLRKHKEDLGMLISMEMGKIYQEGLGEVQEAIDICDYAVGLSRSLNGQVIPSERPDHFMMERWSPLQGHVGIITAFNFPCAVFFWNTTVSMIAGNTQLWKPSESVPFVSLACQEIVNQALINSGESPDIANMVLGDAEFGKEMVESDEFELISFTGSTQVGKEVGKTVGARFGKQILELGGNNAMVVEPDADLDMALRATLFSAVGTSGQRCTSLRRLYLHESIYDEFVEKLKGAYSTVKIGDALDKTSHMGPIHNESALDQYKNIVAQIPGSITSGGYVRDKKGYYVEPTICEVAPDHPLVQEESFVPILYVMKYNNLDEAIKYNNDVEHGLSSALFTKNQDSVFKWVGALGSDCGICNVNIGTSGAEIGGAFGGEKATGGGRESGSDAWKQYMRRSTCTINYGKELPLAQGITFG